MTRLKTEDRVCSQFSANSAIQHMIIWTYHNIREKGRTKSRKNRRFRELLVFLQRFVIYSVADSSLWNFIGIFIVILRFFYIVFQILLFFVNNNLDKLCENAAKLLQIHNKWLSRTSLVARTICLFCLIINFRLKIFI